MCSHLQRRGLFDRIQVDGHHLGVGEQTQESDGVLAKATNADDHGPWWLTTPLTPLAQRR